MKTSPSSSLCLLVGMLHHLWDFVRLKYFAVLPFSPLQIHAFKVCINTVLRNTLGWWNQLHQKQHWSVSPLAELTKRTLPPLRMSIIKHRRSETSALASPAAFDLQGRRDLATWLFIVGSGWISSAEARHSKVFPFLQARRYSSWQEAGICLLRRNPVKVNPNWTPSSRCAETPWSLTHGHAHIKPPPPSRSHAPMNTFQMAKFSFFFF